MNTSEILNKAADYIEQYGWSCGGGWHPAYGQPACLEGAIRVTAENHGEYVHTKRLVRDYLTATRPESINSLSGEVISWCWNDEIGRTANEVIEVLRAAAVIEAAKEAEPARAAVS